MGDGLIILIDTVMVSAALICLAVAIHMGLDIRSRCKQRKRGQ